MILPQFKNFQVKHRGRVVKEMVVRCKMIYPEEKCRLQYQFTCVFEHIICIFAMCSGQMEK